jgi:1-acyl-sn-glycerol-3-phosphate acyltransferase
VLHEIRCWAVVGWRVLRYAVHRIGLGAPPNMLDIRPEAQVMFSNILRWPKTLRVVGAEHCPQTGPAVFVSNHLYFFDPTFAYRAITLATNEAHKIHFMMRNDFFRQNVILRMIDVDTLVACIGAYGITRGNVRLSELKPFLKLLEAGESFIMYPGRTRSKSGLFMEYRDEIEEPGGASFFLHATQRRKPGVRVPAVPMARTYDPVRNQSAYAFGPPHYLPEGADRHAQHAFDLELMDRMGDLVELNVPQLLAAILYLRVLHQVPDGLPIESAAARIRAIAKAVPHRLLHPALTDGLETEVEAAAAYFEGKGQARRAGGRIEPIADSILAAPPLDDDYKKANPTKYLVNQFIHMGDVVRAVEANARD